MDERVAVADLPLLAGRWDETGVADVLLRVGTACAAAGSGR